MEKKKETKKRKIWERWKAKPIIDTKNKTLKEKQEIVQELSKDLPEEIEKKKHNPKWWRPPVMTSSVIDKLKLCFSVWMTDEQSCYFCQISTDVLYKYQREHPEFIKEKDILKESITMQARVNIWRSIKNWNVTDSWQWVKIKDSSFTPKLQVNWNISSDMSEEDQEMYNKILKNNLSAWWNKEMKK